uniref:Uncharacterized protein n=1 Tax=Ascaris lumbricoides TaxID=6252 RepID=A0A0M3ITU6_ASCLU
MCIYRNNHNIFHKLQNSIIFQNTTHYCVYIKCYNGIRKKKS